MPEDLKLNMNAYLPLRDVVFHTLREAILKGDLKLAQQMAYDLNDVSKYLFADVNPIMPKAALAKLGVCGEMVRKPLIPTTDANKKLLFDAMKAFEEKGY